MRLETTLLDKIINRGVFGKRVIGRPSKPNIRTRDRAGWVEIVLYPRNFFEQCVSKAVRAVQPYLAFATYQYHVERARIGGFRVEDIYSNKFFKDPYIHHHIYAQYFHPHTILERVRHTAFFRRPETIFKGYRVPDWAQSQKMDGFDIDVHSRIAWSNAMHDFRGEFTPMQFAGQRLEPNIINWARFEQVTRGHSSRLFYNEVPHPIWLRHEGHFEKTRENLHSFKFANQAYEKDIFGFDTSTEEGRAKLTHEWNRLAELAPEIIKKDDLFFPDQCNKYISTEPHFQRVWTEYRAYLFRTAVKGAIDEGKLDESTLRAAAPYMEKNGLPAANMYVLGKRGHLDANDSAYQALEKVMEAVKMGYFEFDSNTAKPWEEQFEIQMQIAFQMTEEGMMEKLHLFVTDPREKAKFEAIAQGRMGGEDLAAETTSKLQ